VEDASIQIREFDGKAAGEAEYAAWNACTNCLRAEAWPEDPPRSLEKTIREMQIVPAYIEDHRWAAWRGDGSGIVAVGVLTFWHVGENQHAAGFHIGVLPGMRRRGIAAQLLRRVVEDTRTAGRRLLFTDTSETVPAGEAFLRRLGARPGITSHTNQLELSDWEPGALRALLRQWQERAQERAAGFQLGLWEGPYPEEVLDEVVAMKEAVNLMPRGDLELEDEHLTPELLRESNAVMARRGDERWTIFLRDPATGKIAGYTEVWWHSERPEMLYQDDTAVLAEYQNRGLGRWLKAAMLEKVLRDRPQVRRIRTGNADCNAPMLKINTELGFKPYRSHIEWQVEVEKVAAYLASRGWGIGVRD
jgi:mycothiol synthase